MDIQHANTHETPEGVEPVSFFGAKRGLASWLFTVDHKRIGLMYLGAVLLAFLLGGVFALIVRTHLLNATSNLDPKYLLLSNQWYNRMFTWHGVIMVFLVLIPSIPATLGNFFVPIQIGAKDVAFPRINLLSFYVYVVGLVIALLALIVNAADTGWTFYIPYSTSTSTLVIPLVLAAFILGFSSILTGLNFIVTVHKLRAPGMTFDRMPLFIWALYATSVIQILATPVIGITLLLLVVERLGLVGIFDPALGGNPVLFQHFFWFYSHPAVYIMIVPGFGVISELIATFTRRPIFGYRAVALSSIGIALIGFGLWGHHMFVSGQSQIVSVIFGFLTFLVALPTAIKVFNWLATMYKSEIHLDTPFIYALCFLFLFMIGGLTGIFLGTLSADVHLHDTYFVVAHFHYVMVGGTLFAFFGGLHYWWPKMTGKMFDQTLAIIAAIITFVGFNWTFFPQFILGTRGMPRRYATYDEMYRSLHVFSTTGAYVMGVGLLLVAIGFIYSLAAGKKAPANPWGGTTLEWQTSSPPPVENFVHEPFVTSGPYDRESV